MNTGMNNRAGINLTGVLRSRGGWFLLKKKWIGNTRITDPLSQTPVGPTCSLRSIPLPTPSRPATPHQPSYLSPPTSHS